MSTTDNRQLEWNGTGSVESTLSGSITVDLSKRLSASVFLGGEGSFEFALPTAPFLRGIKLAGHAEIEFTIEYLFKLTTTLNRDFGCQWKPESGWNCGQLSATAEATRLSSSIGDQNFGASSISTVDYHYAAFGPYAQFTAHSAAATTNTASQTIVSNIFPGASPQIMGLSDGRQILLWVQMDTSLPVSQSTGIMWSLQDAAGTWSEPQLIVRDAQAEFSPVMGIDASGNVAAAWLRVKEAAFSGTVQTTDDLQRFYKNYEVVTATFNPSTRAWSNVTALTDDTNFDTDLELSSDGTGGLLLSWLSNPDAELMSTQQSPSTLKYSGRTSYGWTTPSIIATQLVGVSHHAAAVHGAEAFVVVSRDPDLAAANDGVLDLYRFQNGRWSARQVFAAGGVENRLPNVAFDKTGIGNVVWQRGGNFVSATLDDPKPRVAGREALIWASTTHSSLQTRMEI